MEKLFTFRHEAEDFVKALDEYIEFKIKELQSNDVEDSVALAMARIEFVDKLMEIE